MLFVLHTLWFIKKNILFLNLIRLKLQVVGLAKCTGEESNPYQKKK